MTNKSGGLSKEESQKELEMCSLELPEGLAQHWNVLVRITGQDDNETQWTRKG